ncbi:MAG: sulfurtransferase [Gammaproteobacteria bacterium]|nr:MAG: sulfurtransferase [Gammaproteobacteria bacterium]
MPSHHSSLRQFTLLAALVLVTACSESGEQADPARTVDAGMDTLVTTEWLSEHLGDPNLVVLDCTVLVEQDENGGFRTVNGRPNYEAGHIPTAGFADLMGDLASGDSPHDFAVPTPQQFAAAMSALGVGDNTQVVLYDAYNSVWAARVWWMLRWIGFDRAAVLDGGLRAWTAEDRPLSTEAADRPARTLTPAVRPELIADRDEVLASIEDDAVNLIDVLPENHYRGEWTMYDRPGHIPGASNVPANALVDDSGRYRPAEELAALFDSDRNARTITYCGGGIAASSDAFIMTRLGFTNVAVYMASLQEWTADPTLPLETSTEFDEFDK